MRIMTRTGSEEAFQELDDASRRVPASQGDLSAFLRSEIFHRLDMAQWVDILLQGIPRGRAVTFGALATALGAPRGARAIGELISSGSLKGPFHRIVFADRTVPPPSAEVLGGEMGLVSTGGRLKVPEGTLAGPLAVEAPPFVSLARVQTSMARFVKEEEMGEVRTVAGLDISTSSDVSVAAMSCMDLSGRDIGRIGLKGARPMPYVGGFLFYCEAPLLMDLMDRAFHKGLLDREALIVLDGNGTIHPRRMGIACQIGAAMDLRTCGAAKKLLTGRIGDWKADQNAGRYAPVMDEDEVIGYALMNGRRSKVYVSRGHRTNNEDVRTIVSRLRVHNVPEPTRRAHMLSNELRRSET